MGDNEAKPNYTERRHDDLYDAYLNLRREVRENHGELASEVTTKWYWNTLSKQWPFSPETIKKIVYKKMKEERGQS